MSVIIPLERQESTVIIRSHHRTHDSIHHYDTCEICYTRKDMPLVPPLNFAMIAPGVYRSGHPNKQNFAFLRKLGLKTIM
jgi:tyrosine-protein phosphatase SIW14